MKQRVMIAMAMACEPALLIADEPTTALDVTIQAQILELMRNLQRRTGMALLLITHNLGIVNEIASRVLVMRRGVVVEQGPASSVLRQPAHEYTRRLLGSLPEHLPRPPAKPAGPTPEPWLSVRDLKVWHPIRRGLFKRVVGHVKAVDGVSFDLPRGRILALVGESGSGKTTMGKAILRLIRLTDGAVVAGGVDLATLSPSALRAHRRRMQMVFQDPAGSLDPRQRVSELVAEGIHSFGLARDAAEVETRVVRALQEVELDPEVRHRFPHEFSGGQRQRICIARALAVEPEFIVLDEATSALDVSVQAEVLTLLLRLQRERGLTMLFITHDLSVVRYLADRVLVMQHGKVVEEGETEDLFTAPRQEYTRRLLASAPRVPKVDSDQPA
jgi:ABC-type microcin C transport system duplicated ATPase subunit YejF